MRTFYLIIVGILVAVVAMLLYPSTHLIIGYVDTTGMLPLVKAVIAFAPYFCLFMAGYGLFKLVRK